MDSLDPWREILEQSPNIIPICLTASDIPKQSMGTRINEDKPNAMAPNLLDQYITQAAYCPMLFTEQGIFIPV